MKVLEQRFLRGPNIYRMAPCFAPLIDLEGHQPVALQSLPGGAALLQMLLPGDGMPHTLDAAELARLTARLVVAAQHWPGHAGAHGALVWPGPFTEPECLAPTAAQHHRLVCSYQHEPVAEAALRLAVDLLTALVRRQPFDLNTRLDAIHALSGACADAQVARTSQTSRTSRTSQRSQTTRPAQAAQVALALPQATTGPTRTGRLPVVAVTGTNGKTTTTQLIAHVRHASGARTGTTTTQGIYIGGKCVQTGDCSGYWSARRVLDDHTVQAVTLETARGGILKRGLAFERCDVGVVLNVSGDHLGLDGVETLQDLAHVKGLVARCARQAAVLNAEDAWCVAMRETLAPGCQAVFFAMDHRNPVLLAHLQAGGAGTCLDDGGWLVWCCAGEATKVVKATDLPFTMQGHARYNTANALAALATLCCLGHETGAIARAMTDFVSDARSNPLRGNQFEVDGVKLIVDYAHNVVAYRALCAMARALVEDGARLLGVVTSPGDRRLQDLYETGQVCGHGFDELVVYEHDPRGRSAGATCQALLRGARDAAPGKLVRGEPRIRHALWQGLAAAQPGDVLVFTCAGSFDDLVEGVRLKSPAAAERIARDVFR